MDTVSNSMMDIFKECLIKLDEYIISEELIIKTFVEFLTKTIESDRHNVGIIMHTGSVCFDAMMLTFLALSNILYNESDPGDTIEMLLPGDTVLYYEGKKKARCRFLGFVDSPDDSPGKNGSMAVVERDDSRATKNFVPRAKWGNIIPYYGTSTSLDGRGLRKENENKNLFYERILRIKPEKISRTIDTSTVVVMDRKYADWIINGLSLSFDDNKTVKLTELVTASFYTAADQEYTYAGNESRAEPVLKITGRVSVARRLLLQKGGNRNIGFVLVGDELLRRSELELADLVDRKSIQYVYLCSHIDSEVTARLIKTQESAKLFACTKDFLLSKSLPTKFPNTLTDILEQQINAIIDNCTVPVSIKGVVTWEEYKQFKKSIYLLKSSDYDSRDKEAFIIQAFSMMNLMMTAPFQLELLNWLIKNGRLENTEMPEERMAKLKAYVEQLPEYIRSEADKALQILESVYKDVYNESPKEQALRKILGQNQGKKIAVIVPKAYFAAVLRYVDLPIEGNTSVTIVTANKFDSQELYDVVIAVGNIEGTRFNFFRCRSTQNTYVLLYNSEKYAFNRAASGIEKTENEYQKRSAIEYEIEEYAPSETNTLEDSLAESEIESIDKELKDYINTAMIRSYRSYIGTSAGTKNVMAEVVSVATFDNDEVAFFSKNYRAYVLDEKERTVKEVNAAELSEGDTVIFTRSSAKTRDVVDDLLRKMIETQRVPDSIKIAYQKSKVWKTKLIEYMDRTGKDAKSIANAMIRNGVHVQEPTIKDWLDEESHTVGPRDLESIRQIALLTEDEDMFDSPEDIYKSCDEIRRVRRKIMEAIARAVLSGITGDTATSDPIFDVVYEQIDDLSIMLQIESITLVNEKVPNNLINRPISDN